MSGSRHHLRWGVAYAAPAALVFVCIAAPAAAMSVRKTYPVAHEIRDGSAFSFAIEFDEPVDHAGSRFTLITPEGERTIHPRLRSEPDTLFGVVGELPPGEYELRWSARSMDGEVMTGTVPFSVKAP